MAKKKEDTIELEGRVVKAGRDMTFEVLLDNGKMVLGYLSGRMRVGNIRVGVGDKVTVEVSPYDLGKARITYRHKS